VWALCAFFASGYIGNPMSISVIDLTVALVEHGTVSIDPYAGNSVDVAYREGHYYSGMAPGTSFLLLPSYLLAKPIIDRLATPAREQQIDAQLAARQYGPQWGPNSDRLRIILAGLAGSVFGSAVASGWLATILYLLLRCWYPVVPNGRIVAIASGTVLATLLFFYAASIDHRVIAAALLMTALWLARDSTQSRTTAFFFGSCLGVSIATSFESVVLAALVAAWWLWRFRGTNFWIATLGAAIPGALLMAYSARCFGAPWATPYAFRLTEIGRPLTKGWNQAFPLTLHQALTEAPRYAVEYLVGSDLGLLTYSPLLVILLLLVAPRFRRGLRNDVACLAIGGAVLILCFHLITGYRLTPGDFGPRYLILAIPFLALLLPAVAVSESVFWGFWIFGLTVVMRGVMYGLLHEPFWSGYLVLLKQNGLASYTLLKWKAIGGGLLPLGSTLLVGTVLGLAFVSLFARRGFPGHSVQGSDDRSPSDGRL
jgi:hypothetical protein